MNDPFATLGIERRFDVDLASLAKTHRELSRALHPDMYAHAGASERRAALEKASAVNEAWRIVRCPIRRAEALFQSVGSPVGDGHEPKASPAFLMEVLEEREALAEARAAKDLAKVRLIGQAMRARAAETEDKLSLGFVAFAILAREPAANVDTAAMEKLLPLLGELRFYRRLIDEVSLIEEENE